MTSRKKKPVNSQSAEKAQNMLPQNDNSGLTAKAKIILLLFKNPPQTDEEICTYAGIELRYFKYMLSKFLIEKEIIKQLPDGRWAPWGYKSIDEKVNEALLELEEGYTVITLIQISNITGLIPKLIEEAAFRLKSNYDVEIGDKPIERGISGISIVQ